MTGEIAIPSRWSTPRRLKGCPLRTRLVAVRTAQYVGDGVERYEDLLSPQERERQILDRLTQIARRMQGET